ncbi:yrdC domain-containing protein, mitochondrial isoform X2 [Dromiciops gliroides]|uniref:yrdC domain-containing protein, mitochondrial isoform X2 n=1 Tax=Dromiciops gliroides TaxID=33562 RepID=UPI001CC64ED4|nr:yrdC domain-containing protein, mitochondrial isoform X2 [Dromiciops gliroides]
MGPVRTPSPAVLGAVEAAAMGLGEGSLAPRVGCLPPSGLGVRLLQLPRGGADSRVGRAAGSKRDLEGEGGGAGHAAGWSEALSAAVTALRAGGLVAVPTDTLYGVACSACCSAALGAVYSLKGRCQTKPLAVCLGRVADIYRYCRVRVPRELLEDLLPGPVTLVMERSGELNKDLNPFTPLVGIRIPDHAFMRELAQTFSGPLALTSANISSQPSSLNVKEFQDLWPQLSLVIDGGPIGDAKSPECRLGSTVVDLSVPGKYRIIRPGCALTQTSAILQKKYGLVPSEEPCS